MTNLHQYYNGEYSGFETSYEILAAIEKIAGDSILDDDSEAARIWYAPSQAERAEVLAGAWKMADPREDCLFWGGKITRVLPDWDEDEDE